jgi:hypothetical protein
MFVSLRLYAIIGAVVVGGGLTALRLAARRKKTAQDLERERRELLDRIGRIIDGTVIDVAELHPNEPHASQLLIYHYDVAGVQYEASQDVTHLRQYVDLHNCRIGVPTSVKYDPQNPGNSIVVSERWSGLHSGTPIVLGIDRMYTGERRQPPPRQLVESGHVESEDAPVESADRAIGSSGEVETKQSL